MRNASTEEYHALDLLIVPSPKLSAEGEDFLEIDPATGLYTGGHLRMCAAAEFATRWQPHCIAVVGGLDPQHGTRMTDTMENFIKERSGGAHVQKINSLPCTRHNVIALFNQLGPRLASGRVAMLTNEYHLRRLLEFWTRVETEYEFRAAEPLAIAAEWIIQTADTDFTSAALERRRKAEDRGVMDFRAGKYVDRCLSQLDSFGDEFATHAEQYLSPKERTDLSVQPITASPDQAVSS
jgi:hypothetical protein